MNYLELGNTEWQLHWNCRLSEKNKEEKTVYQNLCGTTKSIFREKLEPLMALFCKEEDEIYRQSGLCLKNKNREQTKSLNAEKLIQIKIETNEMHIKRHMF